jgi:hypothetical protein
MRGLRQRLLCGRSANRGAGDVACVAVAVLVVAAIFARACRCWPEATSATCAPTPQSGWAFSNIVQFFIILTCASTLHAAGVPTVDTPDKVALALRPMFGDLAYLMFAIGIIGASFLAVPTLAGSASSDIGGAGLEGRLGYTFRQARACYVVIALAMLVGAGLNFVGIPPFRLFYYAAAVNGVLALPLMAMITLVRKNRAFMGRHVNNRFAKRHGLGDRRDHRRKSFYL